MAQTRRLQPRSPKQHHQACQNCRRKKVRCPGERPSCSSCVRLNQACSYQSSSRLSIRNPVEERLAYVEDQLSRILHQPNHHDQDNPAEQVNIIEPSSQQSFGNGDASQHVAANSIANAFDLYFKYCHRQPIWCLDKQADVTNLPDELVHALLVLTDHFTPEEDQSTYHLTNARTAIMLSLTNGSAGLATLQSLCLLSYSLFMDGDFHLGQFHLGLALQLCRSAQLDHESAYKSHDPTTDIKKKLFWSLSILEQSYGSQTGMFQMSTKIWQPALVAGLEGSGLDSVSLQADARSPSLSEGVTETSDVWDHTIHMSWIWSMARKYVSDAHSKQTIAPWRHESEYQQVLSNQMEVETRFPICHRYDTVKFYQRQPTELKDEQDYWKPWLRLQFMYHLSHTVLNHPFLYIVASQHDPNLMTSNTFWRKSMENVLVHATWIARMIDMVLEKQMRLTDPFFAQAAAIAATVHLYYCCAASPSLASKSCMDLAKCISFIDDFTTFSIYCRTLGLQLKQLVQIASGSDEVDFTQWRPTKIHLSSGLMWDILKPTYKMVWSDPARNLLHPSLHHPIIQDTNQTSTLEVTAATSPEVIVRISDGGQSAPLSSTTAAVAVPDGTTEVNQDHLVVVPADNLPINPPLPWPNYSQELDWARLSFQDVSGSPREGNAWDPSWWEFANL